MHGLAAMLRCLSTGNIPKLAGEATLAFLIIWPKSEILRGHHSTNVHQHGFTFEADNMYPAFWTKGPFLAFLRENWRPALDLVIRLVNFATARYEDWWSYEPGVADVSVPTPEGNVQWKGTHQIYAWNGYHMNTPQVVTCALMALEKWFGEQIEAGGAITEAVQMLYQQGRSLSFAGVLISIGKRHPEKFVRELKPLLFVREIYMHDLQATSQYVGGGYWPHDGKQINDLRSEWHKLPGRRTWLKDMCCEWLVKKPELATVLDEVSIAWRKEAESCPEGSDDRVTLLRWASDFDRSFWKEIALPDGRKYWQNERPAELRDVQGEEILQSEAGTANYAAPMQRSVGEAARPE